MYKSTCMFVGILLKWFNQFSNCLKSSMMIPFSSFLVIALKWIRPLRAFSRVNKKMSNLSVNSNLSDQRFFVYFLYGSCQHLEHRWARWGVCGVCTPPLEPKITWHTPLPKADTPTLVLPRWKKKLSKLTPRWELFSHFYLVKSPHCVKAGAKNFWSPKAAEKFS